MVTNVHESLLVLTEELHARCKAWESARAAGASDEEVEELAARVYEFRDSIAVIIKTVFDPDAGGDFSPYTTGHFYNLPKAYGIPSSVPIR